MLSFASLAASFAFILAWGEASLDSASAIHLSPTSLASALYQAPLSEQDSPRTYEPDNNGNPEDSSGAGGRFIPQGSTPLNEI